MAKIDKSLTVYISITIFIIGLIIGVYAVNARMSENYISKERHKEDISRIERTIKELRVENKNDHKEIIRKFDRLLNKIWYEPKHGDKG